MPKFKSDNRKIHRPAAPTEGSIGSLGARALKGVFWGGATTLVPCVGWLGSALRRGANALVPRVGWLRGASAGLNGSCAVAACEGTGIIRFES